MSLEDVAKTTKVPVRVLSAIEDEEFDVLPGGLYRRAYVKSFAAAVGLSGEEYAQSYVAQWEPPAAIVPAEARPRPAWLRSPRPVASGLIAIGMAILALLLTTTRRSAAPTPEKSTPVEEPAVAVHNAEVPPERAAGASADAKATDLRLSIQASKACWISATADGSRVIYRLVQPGETVEIEAASAIVLRVGEPSAIDYTINGGRGRTLGEAGQPVTVRITPDSYQRLLVPADSVAE